MYSVEDVRFVANLFGFFDGGEVVGADENAFGGWAAAFEDKGKVVEGEWLAAHAGMEGLASGEFEGVVETYHDLRLLLAGLGSVAGAII